MLSDKKASGWSRKFKLHWTRKGRSLRLSEPSKVSGSQTLVQGEDFFGDDRLLASIVMASVRFWTSFKLVRDILSGFEARKILGGVWLGLCSEDECDGSGIGAGMGLFVGLKCVWDEWVFRAITGMLWVRDAWHTDASEIVLRVPACVLLWVLSLIDDQEWEFKYTVKSKVLNIMSEIRESCPRLLCTVWAVKVEKRMSQILRWSCRYRVRGTWLQLMCCTLLDHLSLISEQRFGAVWRLWEGD